MLDVQATVSADRKYVTMTLRPQLAQLLNLFVFNFQAAGSTTAGGIFAGPVVSTAASGFLQEPELQITEVRTTVSVPDGGTLLLGGQTLAGEIEKKPACRCSPRSRSSSGCSPTGRWPRMKAFC